MQKHDGYHGEAMDPGSRNSRTPMAYPYHPLDVPLWIQTPNETVTRFPHWVTRGRYLADVKIYTIGFNDKF